MAMTYGNIYVASVAMGAKDEHTLKTFLEAEAYDGPALIIATATGCIAHGIDMTTGMQNQKAAVDSGQWLLYRYNPDLEEQGKNPLLLDSRAPTMPLDIYMNMENRFRLLYKTRPEQAKQMLELAEEDVRVRRSMYEHLQPGSRGAGLRPSLPLPRRRPGQGRGQRHNGHKQDVQAIGPAVASKN